MLDSFLSEGEVSIIYKAWKAWSKASGNTSKDTHSASGWCSIKLGEDKILWKRCFPVPSMYPCLIKVNRATFRKPVSLEKEICSFFLHHKTILWFISSIFFLPHSTPNTLVFLLFLESGKHVLNSEHLHNLFSLCRIPCPTVNMPSSLNHFIPLLKPHLLLEDFLLNYFK